MIGLLSNTSHMFLPHFKWQSLLESNQKFMLVFQQGLDFKIQWQ